MSKYDDASWHYGGDYPTDLPNENAATHIGIFLAWCIQRNLTSDELNDDFEEEAQQVKERKMTGAEFLIAAGDEKFLTDDLNDTGNGFAKDYYESEESDFVKKHGSYYMDYERVLVSTAPDSNFYKVENSWANYDLIKPIIDKRFMEWQQYKREITY